MSGGLKDIAPYAAAAAAIYASGGTAAPGAFGGGAAGGAAGAGAGAASAGAGAFGSADMMAALAPQAGILGDAALATGAEGLVGTGIPYGPEGMGLTGNTIEAAGLTPNAYTGGYDALNPLQRIGQRVGGLMDGHGKDALRVANSMRQRPQAQQVAAQSLPPARRPQQPEQQPVQPLYGSAPTGLDFSKLTPLQISSLSPEEKALIKQKLMMARMGG